MHTQHPLAGKTVRLNHLAHDVARGIVVEGAEFTIEGWWDYLTGGSWTKANGNFAAMHYGVRIALSPADIPVDDEVVYGKIGPYGHLVHVSELGEEIE